ncbi:iron ABC transporter permease [Deinococcus deserti]|uniref:Putative ABC transporter, permease component n=1 Tax=Deinococcus deserti (strain DSM 17065 / CIP 109153 / LMG 22923 / VCD115) TaxID=546414 RepID=C1CXI2_DEIDV|nr:iron ABC transporter permease [Deinococcus deserti]ACO46899.1 putative ABC transporter, permease component [Deinococcus deserti VCD115]
MTYRRPPLALLLPAVLTVLGVLLPLSYLVLRALGAEWTELREIVFRWRNVQLFGNTVLLTVAVLVTTTLVALPLAFLSARSDFRPRSVLLLLGVLPLAIPGYVGAYALIAASGPGGALDTLLGLAWPGPSGFWGALGVLTLFTFPYLFLNLHAALRAQDPALEDAARLLGRSPIQTFRKVTLPYLRPAWLSGALLIALHVLGDFSVVSLMRYPTFSAAIYQQYTAAYDRVYSAWLALLLLLVTAAALWLEARLMRNLHVSRVSPGGAREPRRVQLGRLTPLAWIFAATLAGAALVVPLGTIVYWMRLETNPFAWAGLWEAARTALGAAALAAFTTTLLAFPLAYIGSRYRGRWARVTERAAYLGYATPPLAFALALVFFSLQVAPPLYQTLPLLIAAYTLHFVAEAVGPLRSSLNTATPRLEEAARVLGLSAGRTLTRVTLPLIRPGLLVSAAFVFLSVLKELPLTLLLSPIGFETLARNVWTYTEEAQYASAAPYALALAVSGALLTLLILRRDHPRRPASSAGPADSSRGRL